MEDVRPISVLIVDDDPMVAAVHQGFTERLEGFVVRGVASSGTDALAFLAAEQPDLVLLDVYLPDISGLDLLKEMRTRGIESDVIVVTAAQDADSVHRALHGGAVHYIVKPFPFAKFQSTMTDYLKVARRLATASRLSQSDIDQVFGQGSAPETKEGLPRGVSKVTLEKVVAYLRTTPTAVPADEIALGVGITRTTARLYLEHLAATGQARLEVRYGVGRPEHRFRLIDPGA